MKTLEKVLKKIIGLFSLLALIVIVAMMLLVVCDVVLRIFFKAPIIGATELTQMMMVGMVLALGAGVLGDENITVDFVMNFFPKKAQCVVELVTSSVTIVVCLLIAWQAVESAKYSISYHVAYSLLKVPEYPFLLILAVGFLGGVAAIVVVMMRRMRELRGRGGEGADAPEEKEERV